MVLPLFLFAMVFVLFFFRIIQIQYIVQNSLDVSCAKNALLREETESEIENLTKAVFYKELNKQKCPLSFVLLGAAGFSWNQSRVNETYMDMKVAYQVKLPVSIFGRKAIKLKSGNRIRRWTGYQAEEAGKESSSWVYVTENGSVYHKNRKCTHLKLSIEYVSSKRLETDLRSYAPCILCAKGVTIPFMIYVTKEGSAYHIQLGCSGLKRTIYMIPLTETEGRQPCSRCGGK